MNQSHRQSAHSQRGLMLWHGMTLFGIARLMMKRPALRFSKLHRILSLPVSGLYNSLMSSLESLIFGDDVKHTHIKHDPLFVLGYWRSGTTLLHNLLCLDQNYQHLTTYRMLFPNHFLLTEEWVTQLPLMFRSRPMDNMKIDWDSPQEDDMALCVMGQISPMMLMSHPHDLRYFWSSLDFSRLDSDEVESWKRSLILLLKKMAFADPRPAVLKSPSHTFHIPLLLEMFPNAHFVYIHRHPYDVFRSTLNLRRRGIEENCLGIIDFNLEKHELDIIESYRFGFERYEQDRLLIRPDRLYEIAFEDLECLPISELGAAYQYLQLPDFDIVEQSIHRLLPELLSYKKNSYDHDPYWEQRVYEELEPAYERFGYSMPKPLRKNNRNQRSSSTHHRGLSINETKTGVGVMPITDS